MGTSPTNKGNRPFSPATLMRTRNRMHLQPSPPRLQQHLLDVDRPAGPRNNSHNDSKRRPSSLAPNRKVKAPTEKAPTAKSTDQVFFSVDAEIPCSYPNINKYRTLIQMLSLRFCTCYAMLLLSASCAYTCSIFECIDDEG